MSSGRSILHRLALLTAIATFPLIFMGGLVTSHAAGMSVPDWPNSYGYNMFTFPPSQWVGGIFYEHTHRLMASVVGMLSIAVAIAAWWTEIKSCCRWLIAFMMQRPAPEWQRSNERRWVQWLATSVLGAVIFQGVLGGLRVVWVELDLAIVHACVAQAFFCLATLLAIVTSRSWREAPDESESMDAAKGRSLVRVAMIALAVIYLQLIVGATMRHYQAGLAIPDLPLAYGKILPPTSEAALQSINQTRTYEQGLDAVSLSQVWLHFGHRIGAILVSIAIVWLSVKAIRRQHDRRLILLSVGLLCLLATQITIGVLTVLLRKPADIASAHVACGALVLVSTFALTVRAARLYWPRTQTIVDTRRASSEVLNYEPRSIAAHG